MAVKSPMEYFQEQDFSLPSVREGERREISPAERQFLRKYLGVDDPADLGDMASIPRVEGESVLNVRPFASTGGMTATPPVVPPVTPQPGAEVGAQGDAPHLAVDTGGEAPLSSSDVLSGADALSASGTDAAGERPRGVDMPEEEMTGAETASGSRASGLLPADVPPEASVDEKLRSLETVTMVGFYVSKDVFVVPIDSVLEVIHYTALHRLPKAPSFLPGVVNLRGNILPVINMVELLTLEGSVLPDEHGLIIVCEARGMKLGLLVSRLHTIHKAKQDKFNWNAELHLGSSGELLSGLLETDEKLLGILSVERLVSKLLEG